VAVVVTVIVTVEAADPLGVTEAGEAVQSDSVRLDGSAQVTCNVSLKPSSGVTVRV
jgi:hypothetical protein